MRSESARFPLVPQTTSIDRRLAKELHEKFFRVLLQVDFYRAFYMKWHQLALNLLKIYKQCSTTNGVYYD